MFELELLTTIPVIGATAVSVAGLGLSAISTVNNINRQKEQAEAKRQQLETQNLLAREQFQLSKEQFEQNKQLSRQQYEAEKKLIDQQEQTAQQQAEAQKVQQNLALMQTAAKANQIEEQAKQRAVKLLGQSEQKQAQNLQAQEQQLQQAEQLGEQGQKLSQQQEQSRAQQRQADQADESDNTGRQGSVSPEAVQFQQGLAESDQRLQQNVQNLERQRQANAGFAEERARIARETGENTRDFLIGEDVGSVEQNLAFKRGTNTRSLLGGEAARQAKAFEIQNELNKENIDTQSRLNKLGAEASFFANQAARTSQLTSRSIQTKSRIAQNLSKKSQIQEPGFLDFASAGAQLAGQAVESGLLGNFGGNGTASAQGSQQFGFTGQPQQSFGVGGGGGGFSASNFGQSFGTTAAQTNFSATQPTQTGQSFTASNASGFASNTSLLGG